MIRNSNDEYNFPHKLLLIYTQFQGFVKPLQIIHWLI